jgi:hypothetical protein
MIRSRKLWLVANTPDPRPNRHLERRHAAAARSWPCRRLARRLLTLAS